MTYKYNCQNNLKHDKYFKNKENIYEIISRNLRSKIKFITTLLYVIA